jgi:hypothetical protein
MLLVSPAAMAEVQGNACAGLPQPGNNEVLSGRGGQNVASIMMVLPKACQTGMSSWSVKDHSWLAGGYLVAS